MPHRGVFPAFWGSVHQEGRETPNAGKFRAHPIYRRYNLVAQRFGTISLLFFFARIIRYYARNRTGIQDDPSVTPTLFGIIDSCINSIEVCHDAIKLVLPIGD